MKTIKTLCIALGALAVVGCNKEGGGGATSSGGGNKPAAAGDPKSEDQKALYALGYMMGKSIQGFQLKADELAQVEAGLADSVAKTPAKVDIEVYRGKLAALEQSRRGSIADGEKNKGKAYAETAAKESGATKTDSGLVMKTMTPGKGASPQATDTVKVHYHGTLIDGTVFDSSVKRGEPAEFPLNRVVPCWTEGVQKMKVGEKAKLVCPSSIAYGDQGRPGIPPGATLIFEVELLEIKKAEEPGKAGAPMSEKPSPKN